MLLDLFLVAAELLLDLVDALVHGRFGGRPLFGGDEVVLVLGRGQDFDLPGVLTCSTATSIAMRRPKYFCSFSAFSCR